MNRQIVRLRQTVWASVGAFILMLALGVPGETLAQSVFQQSAGSDLIMGFRASGGVGVNNSVIVNLGAFSSTSPFSEFTLNLGTYLDLAYGAGWSSRTDLFWGVVGTDFTKPDSADAWLSRTTGSSPPIIGESSSLSLEQLYLLQGTLDNIVNPAQQSGSSLANASVSDSSGTAHAVSVYSEAAVAGWKYYLSDGFNKLFPAITDTPIPAPSSLTVSYYTSDANGNGVAPVDMMGITMNNGIFTFSSSSGNAGGGGGYQGPWNWTNSSGNWGVSNNWASNQVASNGVAVGISGVSGGMITNDAVTNISSLTFSNGAGSYTLTGTNPSQSLTVTGGITNNSSKTQTIDLSIAGSGGVTQSGSGTMVLARSNSYTGGTLLNAGTVSVRDNSGFGTGTVTVAGASTLQAGQSILTTSNAMAFNAATTIDTGANRWTNAGALSGSGSLAKSGAGTLTITGIGSTFGGNTAVNAGTLQVGAGSSLGAGSVTVASGARLAGSGTVGGVALQNGGILTGGVDGGVGRLTVSGNMTFSAGGILNWKLSDASGSAGLGFDSFAVGGTLNLGGLGIGSTLQFNILNGSSGTANFLNNQNSQWLVASAGSITGFSTNDFTISTAGFTNALGGGAFGFITNATGLYLKFTALGVDPWTGNIAAGSSVIAGQTITSTNRAVIGADSSRNGGVSVTNNGVWNVQGTLQVGGSTNGSGTLTIGSGGRVSASSLAISDLKGSKGLVLITNGAAQNAISLGSGTVSFGSGNGTLQFAQSNAVTLSNAIAGKGTISSTGTGTTTLSGNQAAFSGTNYLSAGKVVLATGVTNGGTVNIAGKDAVFALNTNAVLSSTNAHAVAGTLLDNSGLAFKDAVKGQVVLASTGILQKTYAANVTTNVSVAGFGAGLGAGKAFSILAGTARVNGGGFATLQASMTNGALDFKGTFTNAAVLSVTDPSFTAIKNTIQWYNTNTGTWQNTVMGNTANQTNASKITGLNGKSFAGSFDSFLLSANVPVNLGLTDANRNGSLLDDLNGLSGSMINSTLAKIMGAFGYDSTTRTSWAVINHNSLFSGSGVSISGLPGDEAVVADLSVFNPAPADVQVVPEPGTWSLMLMGVCLLMFAAMRRKGWRT